MPSYSDYNRDNVYLYSNALVEKGDHFRLQDVNLSYLFDKSAIAKLPFERLQLYFYANNLGILWKATKTKLDPDYMTFKPVKSFSVGVKVDF